MGATYGTTKIQALVPPFWHKKVTFNLFQRSVQMMRIWMSGLKQRGGELLRVPVVIGEQGSDAVGYHAKGTTWTKASINPTADHTRGAVFNWIHWRMSINIDPVDVQKYGHKDAIVDFVAHELDVTERMLAAMLGADLYNGNGGATPAQLTGLMTVAAASSTAYGSIQNESDWAGVVDSTTATIGLDVVGNFIDDLTYDTEKPTVGYSNYYQVRKLIQEMQPQLRFQDATMAKAGFKSVMVDADIPIFPDHLCPQTGSTKDQLFMYNERYRHFVKDPSFFPWKSPIVFGQSGLDWVQSLLYAGIFYFTKRRTVGVMNNLTPES